MRIASRSENRQQESTKALILKAAEEYIASQKDKTERAGEINSHLMRIGADGNWNAIAAAIETAFSGRSCTSGTGE